MAERRSLNFDSTADVVAELVRLRAGYRRAGQWSLPQACFHLGRIMASAMKPGPFSPDTAEQTARKPVLAGVLASGRVPDGLVSPDEMTPPADAPDGAIDDFVATLARFDAFKGELAPHRLFGHMPDADRRRHQMIHCAHHLSYLVPTAV